MMKHSLLTAAACGIVAGFTVGCVHKTEEPSLTGPSTFGRSLTITATPDHINQDGASKSSIDVQVIRPDGQPISGMVVRFDIAANGSLIDFGKLSARTAVTGSDGKASVVFTAPPPSPPPFDSTINNVSVQAVLLGTDAQTTNPISVELALVPPGAILGPADTPTAQFLFFPSAPTVGAPVHFDGSASCPGATANGTCAGSNSGPIVSYAWRFGDGTVATGVTADHPFSIAQKYSVTLTVTNSRGVSAASTTDITVVDGNPTAAFTAAVVDATSHTMAFDGSASTSVAGSTVVSYQWSFAGGPLTAPSPVATITHAFSSGGPTPVRLVVTDNFGRQSTTPATLVTVP